MLDIFIRCGSLFCDPIFFRERIPATLCSRFGKRGTTLASYDSPAGKADLDLIEPSLDGDTANFSSMTG